MISVENMLDFWAAAMWRASWQGGFAALSVWILLLIVPSIPARFQCWLWRLVMLKFVVSFVWSVPIELPLLPAAITIESVPNAPILADSFPSESVGLIERPSFSLAQPLWIAFVLWSAAVIWQMARIVFAFRNSRRLKNACRVSENKHLVELVAKSSSMVGFSNPPLVLESEGQGSPLLIGILRPAIVLPTITMNRLDASELRLVISHELAHVVRRDLVCSLFAAIIRGLFYFHPLAWFSERQMSLAQEMAADELAMELQHQNPAKYASILLSVVSKIGSLRMVPTISVGAVFSHRSLMQRLSAMRFIKSVSSRTAILYGLVLGLVALPCLVPCSIVAAKASMSEQTESKETTIKGKFVSYKDGVLKVRVLDDGGAVRKEYEWKVTEEIKVVSHIRGAAKEGTARDAFQLWESGANIAVRLIDSKVTFVELGKKNSPDRIPEKSADRIQEKSPDRVPEKPADKTSQTAKTQWGRFVSFKAGLLTVKSNTDELLETRISENTKILVWDDAENIYKPAPSAVILAEIKDGTWVVINVADKDFTLRIGARKGSTTGSLVSFKDGRLLMLGKDLGEKFTKKYGNNLHFNKFRNDVPAYESVDGGEYKLIGTANKVLSDVKEGSVLTVHGEGDDNITLVQIGVPKK